MRRSGCSTPRLGRWSCAERPGHRPGVPVSYLPASCNATGRGPFTPPPSCTQALSQFRGFLTYQPASRYWAFQGIETGIFVLLAAALVAVTAAVLLRRDA